MEKFGTLLTLTSALAMINSGFAFRGLTPINITEKFRETRERMKSVVDLHRLPYREQNPKLVTNDTRLSCLCKNNIDGNYQDPFNCNQFIMCANENVYLGTCPADGVYGPVPDMCLYRGQEQCPWSSIWIDPDQVRCDTLGQRPFWSFITFPAKPRDRCSRDIFYCKNYKTLGTGTCPAGYGYSRAYLACLPIDECYAIDYYFQL